MPQEQLNISIFRRIILVKWFHNISITKVLLWLLIWACHQHAQATPKQAHLTRDPKIKIHFLPHFSILNWLEIRVRVELFRTRGHKRLNRNFARSTFFVDQYTSTICSIYLLVNRTMIETTLLRTIRWILRDILILTQLIRTIFYYIFLYAGSVYLNSVWSVLSTISCF